MKRITRITLAGAVFVLAVTGVPGCNPRGPAENSVQGPQGEKLNLGVPEKVTVAQGGETKFSVAAQREKVIGAVLISFGPLPEGVTVSEKEGTIASDQHEVFFTLKADKNAKPVKEQRVKVNAALGSMKTSVELKVTVSESLDNKAARKEAYVKATQKRLDDNKKQMEEIQEKLKTAKDRVKSDFLKRLSSLSGYRDNAVKDFNHLVATPAEAWEASVTKVTNSVNSLEKSTRSMLEEVNQVK